eukprot:maker-scaffold364_size194629-snap-gene-0.17 protein:Tk12397 transcript:maker-scaffold364_size194629-snap-gene-0.17-mRNA-1 annotation:"l-seryl-trnasec kinase"
MVIRGCILALLGLPGSGKSTLASELKRGLKDRFNVILVTFDALLSLEVQQQLCEQSDEKAWKEARKAIVNSIRAILSPETISTDLRETEAEFVVQIRDGNLPGDESQATLVIVDDNNYYSSMRYELFQVARQFEMGFGQIYLDVPLEVCQKQNKLRSSGTVPNVVIATMSERFERPNPLKNPWERFSFAIQSLDGDLTNTLRMCDSIVELALDNPVKPVPDNSEERDRSRRKCTASVIHQADKLLRQRVGRKIRELRTSPSSEVGSSPGACQGPVLQITVQEARVELLEDLKTGFTDLPASVVRSVENRESQANEKLDEVIGHLFELKLDAVQKRDPPPS